jgi:hypothetical protein
MFAAAKPISIDAFLRAGPERLHDMLTGRNSSLAWFCAVAICGGAGLYGAVMGSWCAALQALYVALKLPLLMLLTTLGNALLNAMLAPLLGLDMGFRQSLAAVLMSFAIAALILGALSPVALFVVWNTPPLSAMTRLSSPEYGFLQLTHVAFIAFAGTVGNLRLEPVLRQWTDRPTVARKVLFAWLAGNLFLGSQICWVLRPFIWDPARPVVFIGREYFHGSFCETVFEAARRLLFP